MLCSTFNDLIKIIEVDLSSTFEVLESRINSFDFEAELSSAQGKKFLIINKNDMSFQLIQTNESFEHKSIALIFYTSFSKGLFSKMDKKDLKNIKKDLLIRFPDLNDTSKYEILSQDNYMSIDFIK